MRIDINAFFGHWPYWPLPHTSGDDTLRLMDEHGIDHAAITSLRGLHGDWREANAETLALATAHADRMTPIASISPMAGNVDQVLRAAAGAGFRGVRLYPLLLQGYSLQSAFANEVGRVAGELDLLVIVPTRPMMNFRFPTVAVEEIAALADRHPATSFLLSGPNYLSEFNGAIEAMHRCANLAFEVSCMQGFRAMERIVAAAGAERVLFGTGLPLQYPACNVAKLEHAALDTTTRAAVEAGNARRLLGLDSV
ncbi:MAG: amidohydrolase [Phycisphaerae bacterium]|nr:amidohydrolase [Phycisphaerae bacterium]